MPTCGTIPRESAALHSSPRMNTLLYLGGESPRPHVRRREGREAHRASEASRPTPGDGEAAYLIGSFVGVFLRKGLRSVDKPKTDLPLKIWPIFRVVVWMRRAERRRARQLNERTSPAPSVPEKRCALVGFYWPSRIIWRKSDE